jgi:hypothetical protein
MEVSTTPPLFPKKNVRVISAYKYKSLVYITVGVSDINVTREQGQEQDRKDVTTGKASAKEAQRVEKKKNSNE